MIRPLSGGTYSYNYLQDRGSHKHAGIDISAAEGTPVYAVLDGTVRRGEDAGGYGHYITMEHGNGLFTRYGHLSSYSVPDGNEVEQGREIGRVGNTGRSSGPHLHFEVRSNAGFGDAGTYDPKKYLDGAELPTGGDSGEGNDGSGAGGGGEAKAAAFAAFIQLPGIIDKAESLMLQGKKSLMNDQSLLPFIEQLATASLRSFQSMPNGNFFAFMPDYFGGLSQRTAYWEIDDIEIIDGQINLSDDALSTHVFSVGDVALFDGEITSEDKIQSAGVVTIFDAFVSGFINLPNTIEVDRDKVQQQTKDGTNSHMRDSIPKDDAPLDAMVGHVKVLDFLSKYGARPYFEEEPAVRSPFYELFVAYQKFMLLWSRQFLTTFTFTFMPELYPGGIVAFPQHGIQCYIDEVTHECDYESGFVTRANLSAPAALANGPVNVSEGMVRAFSMGDALPGTDTTASPSATHRTR